MKERPIDLRADEVRAILAGRKTQFRRVIWGVPTYKHLGRNIMDWPLSGVYTDEAGHHWLDVQTDVDDCSHDKLNCTYSAPGDRLWVRECWAPHADMPGAAIYRCDPGGDCQDNSDGFLWRSSVHMPREFSRITIEVVSVRLQRLQDISEEDAKAEGCSPLSERCRRTPGCGSDDWPEYHQSHRENFRRWWESIYEPRSWDENQWVWVVDFKVIKGGAQ